MQKDRHFSSAKNYALRLIKFRVRSQKEIRDKLKKKDYEPEVIEKVVEYLSKARLLDDALFARLWVSSRIKRNIGVRRLSYELRSKGIDKNLIEAALDEFRDNYCEERLISEIISHKIKNMRRLKPEKIKSRLFGYLLRRGYSRDLIIEALRNLEVSQERPELKIREKFINR